MKKEVSCGYCKYKLYCFSDEKIRFCPSCSKEYDSYTDKPSLNASVNVFFKEVVNAKNKIEVECNICTHKGFPALKNGKVLCKNCKSKNVSVCSPVVSREKELLDVGSVLYQDALFFSRMSNVLENLLSTLNGKRDSTLSPELESRIREIIEDLRSFCLCQK